MRTPPVFAILCALALLCFIFGPGAVAISASEENAILELASQFPLLSTSSQNRFPSYLWNSSQVSELCNVGGPTFAGLECTGTNITKIIMYVLAVPSHPAFTVPL